MMELILLLAFLFVGLPLLALPFVPDPPKSKTSRQIQQEKQFLRGLDERVAERKRWLREREEAQR